MKIMKMNRKLIPSFHTSILILFCGIVIESCSSSTPETLAKECCDCYKEQKSLNNTTARDRKLYECANLQTSNQMKLEQLGIDNNWTDKQVSDARNWFENVLNSCN